MDISQLLLSQQKITFETDAGGKTEDYPCIVRKSKKNLVVVVFESKLKDTPVCALGTKITLKWTEDKKPYSILTKVLQNRAFPLVVLTTAGQNNKQAVQKRPPSASVPATFDYIRDLINEIPQLYSLGSDEVNSLVTYVSYKSAKKGTLIFKEGEASDSLFYIAKGTVDIIKESVDGNQIRLARFIKNSMLGELALVDSTPRSATAKVIADVELIILSRESFEGLLEVAPAIGIKIFKQIATTISQRVRFANGRLADVLDKAHQKGIAIEDDDKE